MRTPNLAITLQSDDAESSMPAPAPSPVSSPRSPHTPLPQSPMNPSFAEGYDLHPNHRSPMTAMPAASPKTKTKSFFSNPIASRSATKLPKSESPSRQAAGSPPHGPIGHPYSINRAMGSSPELGITNIDSSSLIDDRSSTAIYQPGPVDYSQGISNAPKKKSSKHKFNILGRKTSLKDEDNTLVDGRVPGIQKSRTSKAVDRTKQHREMLRETGPRGSALRNMSGDRQGHQDDNPGLSTNGHHASLQQNLRNTGTRAADGFGRAAKGLLGKLSTRAGPGDSRDGRSSRIIARDEAEAQRAAITKSYKVVNLPLDQQTRRTRICKRLEDCKDKTEFWLPAVAYRCIDYLNDKGMTHEGLYRVPGSEREIRNWIWRFDNELDIDILAETELYDVNTISSMFKAWLRDLPDEVFPKAIQHKISDTIGNLSEQQAAPEILKTELSNLPPFNYYLLFAVTAHITMLLNASKENKMTFHNLCVCFMPALKMEMPCFTWLILDWKNCWQGCATEREYMEREYELLAEADGGPPTITGEAAGGRARPVQHFDRYDRYGAPIKQSLNARDADEPESFSSLVESALKATGSSTAVDSHSNGGDRSVDRRGNVSSPSPSSSPDLRPSTSPTGPQQYPGVSDKNVAAFAETRQRAGANDRAPPFEGLSVAGGPPEHGQQKPQHRQQHQHQQPLHERSGSEPVAARLDGKGKQHGVRQHHQPDRASETPARHRGNNTGLEDPPEPVQAQKRGERVAETPGRKEAREADTVGRRSGAADPPELSPVKPLSPFGNFT